MIMMRGAEDDMDALIIANAAEEAGAVVVALTPNGEATHPGALAPHTCLIVWARVDDDAHIARVDQAIEAAQDAWEEKVRS